MAKQTSLVQSSPEYKGISELNIIYEAGVDNESRPVLILCACNLPDPDAYDYDLILGYILARLDEFVENDYVLVFLSSPALYRPPWLWLLKAYRSLDRKYKKNLKALYCVHLARSYRLLFHLANQIVSPKFARKLHYLSSLRELYSIVDVSRWVPDQVRNYDVKLTSTTNHLSGNSEASSTSIFGQSLDTLASMEGGEEKENFIPAIAIKLVDHLRKHGLDKEGLFRKSPASEELNHVKQQINSGQVINFEHHDINVAASLLKVFFRDMPQPIIPMQLNMDMDIPDEEVWDEKIIERTRSKLETHYGKTHETRLLAYLCKFLHEVTLHTDKNRMTAHNLAVVFAPNLIREDHESKCNQKLPSNETASMGLANAYLDQMNRGICLVRCLITEHERIFSTLV